VKGIQSSIVSNIVLRLKIELREIVVY